MNLFLILRLTFLKTLELTSEFTTTCKLDKHQVCIFYAYYVYELIFRTKEYHHSEIYHKYYMKICNSTEKRSFFQQTHFIILERLANKFTKFKRVTFNNIYHLPIKKFIKENNSYMEENDAFLMKKYYARSNKKYDQFINLCISNYIDIVVNKEILKTKEMDFFNDLVQTDKEGFYVHKSNLNNFIYKNNFDYRDEILNLSTEKEIKRKIILENDTENIRYLKIFNLSIINFHMNLREEIIARKTKSEENINSADIISKLELKFDKVMKIFTGDLNEKDEKKYLELETSGGRYEYFKQEKDEQLKILLESYFFHLYKETNNMQELINLSTECIMKKNTDLYAEYFFRIGLGRDNIYIYLT